MRIRLDKLFLSAGLALAVIATTIPAIAGTPANGGNETEGWSYSGITTGTLSNDSTLGSTLNVSESLKVGDWTGTKKTTTATLKNPTSDGNTKADENLANELSSISEDLVSNKLTAEGDAITFSPIEAKTTYEFALSKTISWEATVAGAMTEEAIKADIKTNKATLTKDIIEDALGEGYTAAEPVEVSVNIDLSSVNPGSNSTGTEGQDGYVAATKASCTASITAKYTAVITTEETSLPSGYTYDIVKNKENTKAYVLYQYDVAKDTFEKVSLTDVNDGGSIKYAVTDISKAYILASKTVSVAGTLIFAQTTEGDTSTNAKVTSGNYTATINNAADNAELKAQVAEGDKYVSTFNISVALTGGGNVDSTTSPITFKIAVPQDLPAVAEGYTRTYKVIRAHNNNGTIEYTTLDTTFDGTYIIFESDVFSDYALVYSDVAADTTENPTEEEKQSQEQQPDGTTTPDNSNGSGGSSSEKGASSKTADNSMMPLFMTTLLLALCAGSLAIYKEKKTN